jgi:hypothetical protein
MAAVPPHPSISLLANIHVCQIQVRVLTSIPSSNCRFEQLALQYDEDEIGSLEDEDELREAAGLATLDDFGGLMDEFLAENPTSSLVTLGIVVGER